MNDSDKDRPRRGRSQPLPPPVSSIDTNSPMPVERQAYQRIREALMSGLIAPGSSLTGRSLATALGVSAQPVRDALKRLEADGVLESRPQSGFYLRNPTGAEYWEITEIRQRLEGLAGRIAAGNMTDETVMRLRDINEGMAGLTEPKAYLERNYRFHFLIYSRAERPTLLATIANFWVRIGPCLQYHTTKFDHSETLAKHNAIIEALAHGDGPAAEAAIAHDLGTAAELIVPKLDADRSRSIELAGTPAAHPLFPTA